MEEELISFKTAKLAKEKGFKWTIDNKLFYNHNSYLNLLQFSEEDIPAPTQALLQKWLREVHNIHIVIQYWTGNPKPHKPVLHYKTTINKNFFGEHCITYEEALEEGLFEALKLIK